MTTETPTLNRRQLAKERTRQKVLNAARSLFVSKGYAASTIRDIAAEAGMSTGAVFANFADKEALWAAAFGGPPPERFAADEISRLIGELPEASWAFSYDGAGGFAGTISLGDGRTWSGSAASAAGALSQIRAAGVDAQAMPLGVAA